MFRTDRFHHRGDRAGAEENLAFSVDDVFLQIDRDGFALAEIFHSLGYIDARLLADMEERVDGQT